MTYRIFLGNDPASGWGLKQEAPDPTLRTAAALSAFCEQKRISRIWTSYKDAETTHETVLFFDDGSALEMSFLRGTACQEYGEMRYYGACPEDIGPIEQP